MSLIIKDAIVAKSDQMNSDDLMGGAITIKVRDVTAKDDQKQPQPISIFYEGDNNKPWKPCKSMLRVITALWTNEAKSWVGRKITLYRDEKVIFGGDAVGGIRISHMSHIDREVSMPLTASRGSKKTFTVRPLQERKSEVTGLSVDEWNQLQNAINNSLDKDELVEAANKVMSASERMSEDQKKIANDLYKSKQKFIKDQASPPPTAQDEGTILDAG